MRQLRIQVQQKGRKPKPAMTIRWDGETHPLPIVQKRSKGVASLRNKDDGTEYTAEQLRRLPEKALVVGSAEPSELPAPPPAAADESHRDASTSPPKNASCSCLDGTIEGCSKHAKHRMCQRDITMEKVLECCEAGDRQRNHRRKEEVSHGALKVIQGRDGTIVTAFMQEKERIPCDYGASLKLERAGTIESVREGLGILIWYNEKEGCFDLSGHDKAIERASTRLKKAIEFVKTSAEVPLHVVRVSAPKNVCGHVVGKNGRNIKSLKQTLCIGRLSVSWDSEGKEIVLSTTAVLSAHAERTIRETVQRIVKKCSQQGMKF